MKHFFLILGLSLIIVGAAFADGQLVEIDAGTPRATKTVYVDNTARTIQSLYEGGGGTWLNGVKVPSTMLFSCESKDIRVAFGGTTPTASLGGHLFSAGSSWDRKGRYWMSTGKFIAASASDNVTCTMTPED